jgi:hypothetical protein
MSLMGKMAVYCPSDVQQIYTLCKQGCEVSITKHLLRIETTASESDKLPDKLLSYSYGRLMPSLIDIGSDMSASIKWKRNRFIKLYTVQLTPALILFLWRGRNNPPSGPGHPHSRGF